MTENSGKQPAKCPVKPQNTICSIFVLLNNPFKKMLLSENALPSIESNGISICKHVRKFNSRKYDD